MGHDHTILLSRNDIDIAKCQIQAFETQFSQCTSNKMSSNHNCAVIKRRKTCSVTRHTVMILLGYL